MKISETNQNEPEGYFLVPKSWLHGMEGLQRKILGLLEKGSNFNEVRTIGDYISETEAKKLLGRKTTWFWLMRNNGKLPFSKVGNKVFYQKSDIIKLLDEGQSQENHFEQFQLRKVA